METGKMQKFRGLAGRGKHRGIDLGRQIIFTARIKFRKKKASSFSLFSTLLNPKKMNTNFFLRQIAPQKSFSSRHKPSNYNEIFCPFFPRFRGHCQRFHVALL